MRLVRALSRYVPFVGTLALALICGSILVDAPLTSRAVAASTPSAPTSVRAVAVKSGTEVRFKPPTNLALKPTGYQTTSCGPFSAPSAALATAVTSACVSAGKAAKVTNTNATTFAVTAPCVPNTKSQCVIAVRTVAGKAVSTPVTVVSGGIPHPAPTNVVLTPQVDGKSVAITWAVAAPPAQPDGASFTPTFEVYRGGTQIADALSSASFTDTACGLGAKCTYTIAAVSPAGRSMSATATTVTLGTAAPTMTLPKPAFISPGQKVSGQTGHGVNDARIASINFVRDGLADATPVVVQAARDGAGLTAVVPNLAPGYYLVSATQGNFIGKPVRLAIAPATAVSLRMTNASGAPVGTLNSFTAQVSGTAISGAVGQPITIENRVLAASTKVTKAPTTSELAALFSAVKAGTKSTVNVTDSGTWSVTVDVFSNRDRFFVMAASQSRPDGKIQTAYTIYKSPKSAAPAPPQKVVVTTSSRTLAVSWSAPANDGGSPVTSYRVTTTPSSAGCTTSVLGCSITGLTNGVSYSLSVVAINAVGTSTAASGGPAFPVGVPSAPTHINARGGDGQVLVTWQVPDEDGGTPITGYMVSVSPGGMTCGTKATDEEPTRCTFTSLANGTSYAFSIVAANAGGTSSAVTVTATPRGAPISPTLLTAVPGDKSITVNWAAGTSDGGSSITSYTATALPGGRTCTTDAAARSCTISGLANGTTYSITVIATNTFGDSAPSGAASTKPTADSKPTVPSAPRNVSATAGDSSLTISWDAPTVIGGRIQSYKAKVTPGGQECSTSESTTCEITGLDNYAIYTVNVVATNSAGDSPAGTSGKASFCALASPFETCFLGSYQVQPPLNVHAERTDSGVEVSFEEQFTGQFGVVSYYLVTAAPSGLACMAFSTGFSWGDQPSRPSCTIYDEVSAAETFRVQTFPFWGLPSAPTVPVLISPPPSAVLDVPRYVQNGSITLTGHAYSIDSFWVWVMPSACDTLEYCPQAPYFQGILDEDGTASVQLQDLSEDTYKILIGWRTLKGDYINLPDGPSMSVDRTAPQAPEFTGGYLSQSTLTGTITFESGLKVTLAYTSTNSSGTIECAVSEDNTFTCDMNEVPQGALALTVTATDGAGNSSTTEAEVMFDIDAPVVSVSSPGSSAAAGFITVSGTSPTAVGDSGIVTIVARGGAAVVTTTARIVDGKFSADICLSPGAWTITVTRGDSGGNRTVITRIVTVETAVSDISIILPANNSTTGAITTVTGTATAGALVTVSVDGTDIATVTTNSDGLWRTTVNLEAGGRSIAASSSGSTATTQFLVGSAPALSIAPMGPGGRTASRRLCGTSPAGGSVTVSYSGGVLAATADSAGVWCTSIAALADGVYSMTGTAGTSVVTRTIIIDRTAPALQFTSPSTSSTKSTKVLVSSPSSTGDSASVTVDIFSGVNTSGEYVTSITAAVVDSVIALTLPDIVVDGTWTLFATRFDASGNRGTASITFTLDTVAPALTSNLSGDMQGPLVITGVAGNSSGDQNPTVDIDGTKYSVVVGNDGAFRIATGLGDGTYTATLSQEDAAGNVTTSTVTVRVDSVAPNLTWNLTSGAASSSLLISGTASGSDGGITVTAVPEQVGVAPLSRTISVGDGQFSATLGNQLGSDALGGWWNVTATRKDAAGNATTLTARVFIDPRATSLSLAGTPTVVGSSTLTIAGSAETAPWLTSTISITIRRGDSVIFTRDATISNGGFLLSTTLPDGIYTVTAVRAAALNPMTENITVQVDTSSPTINISAAAGTVGSICGTTGKDFGDSGQVRVTFTRGSTTANVDAPVVNGRFCAVPPTSGLWSAKAQLTDAAGNSSAASSTARTFDVESPQPSIAETSPPTLPDWWQDWYQNPENYYIYGVPQWHGFLRGTASTDPGDDSTVSVHLTKSNCNSNCERTLTAVVAPDGTWSVALADVTAGTWYVDWAEQTDSAGNTGRFASNQVKPDRYWLIVDHTAPTAPTFTASGIQVCPPAKGKHVYTVYVKAYLGSTLIKQVKYPEVLYCLHSPDDNYPFSDGYYAADGDLWLLPNGRYTLIAEMVDETGASAASAGFIELVAQTPARIVPRGLVSDVTDQPETSANLGDHPVLTGTTTVDGVADNSLFMEVRSAWGGSFFYAQSIPVDADGTWSWAVPADFRVGEFEALISQGGPNYSGGRTTYLFSITAASPTFDSVVMQKRFTLPNGVQYNSILLTGTIPPGRQLWYGRVKITAPWVQDRLVNCSNFTVVGNQWSCDFYGPTVVDGYGADSGYKDREYTFQITLYYQVVTDYYQWQTRSYYRSTGEDSMTATTTVLLKATTPAPVINTPAKPGQWQSAAVVKGDFTITGNASTGPGDNSYVTAEIYSGREVKGTPAATSTIVVDTATGAFNKSIALADGTWTVRVCQSDAFSQTGCSDSTALTMDNTGPALTINWPSADAAKIPTGYAGGTLTGGYGDATGWAATYNSTYAVATVQFFRGTDLSAEPVATKRVVASPGGSNNGWGVAQSLSSGQWTVRVSASDRVGNSTVLTRTFTVDAAATAAMTPAFTIYDPYGSVITDGWRLISGASQLRVVSGSSIATGATPPPTGNFTLLADGVAWATGSFDSTGGSGVTVVNPAKRDTPYNISIRYDGDNLYSAKTSVVGAITVAAASPQISIGAYAQYGAGRGAWIRLSAGFDRPGLGWTSCLTGQAIVYDSDGSIIAQGSLSAFDRGVATGSIAQGTRDVTITMTSDSQCQDASATKSITLTESLLGAPSASASFDPAPYVGNSLPITVKVSGATWGFAGWLAVPVWLLDAQGRKIGSPQYTSRFNDVTFDWTPTSAGNISLTFQAGGAGTGFAEARTTISIPVEASRLTMEWSFNPTSTKPGQAMQSTLTVGGAGNQGQVKVSSSLAPSTQTSAVISCATTCSTTTTLPDALLDSGTGDIIGTFTSAATGRTFTAQTRAPRTAWQPTIEVTTSSSASVERDTMVPVVARVTFPADMPARMRTGQVLVYSAPGQFCAHIPYSYMPDPTGYCANTRFEVSVNVSTRAASVTRTVASNTATTTAVWEGSTLVITSELFVGGTFFDLNAVYVPTDATVVAAASGTAVSRLGVGSPAMTVQVASALITGGIFSPPGMPLKDRPDQEIVSWSGWGQRNPRVGETAFVKVQFDSELTTPADRDEYFALAYSLPGLDPEFIDTYGLTSIIDARQIRNDQYHDNSWYMAYWDDDLQYWAKDAGLPSCTNCLVWAITNLDSSERRKSGGLSVGDRTLGLISYRSMWWVETSGSATEMAKRSGILGFHLTVEAADGTQRSTAAIKDDQLKVDTAARWFGLAPDTPADAGSISVTVRLTSSSGTTTDLVECYYAGFCLDKDASGNSYAATKIVPLRAQASMSITLTEAQKQTVTNGGTITVITTAPWGETLISDPITPTSPAIAASGSASVSVAGMWLGANLEVPDLTSPFGIFGWGFYENTKMFWEYVFGAGKAADFFITLTGILAKMAFEYLLGGGPMGAMSALGKLAPTIISGVKTGAVAGAKAVATFGRRVFGITRTAAKTVKVVAKVTKPQSAMVTMAKKWLPEIAKAGCKVSPRIYSATVPVRMQRDDELFGKSSCVVMSYQAAAVAIANEPEAQIMENYSQTVNDRIARLRADNPPPKTNVGMGVGVAIQYTHSFSSISRLSIPGLSGMSSSDKDLGRVTIDAYSDPGGGGKFLKTLGSCTFAGLCSAMEGLEANMSANSIVLAGVYPQAISWTPSGAWLRVTVNMPDGTKFGGSGDIAFGGNPYDCWKVWMNSGKTQDQANFCHDIDSARKFTGATWDGKSTYQRWYGVPWPADYNPMYDMPADSRLLTSSLP